MCLFVLLFSESRADPLITDDVAENARLRVHAVESIRTFFLFVLYLAADTLLIAMSDATAVYPQAVPNLNDVMNLLQGIDGRLNGIEGRLDGIEGRLDGIQARNIATTRNFRIIARNVRLLPGSEYEALQKTVSTL
jgi:hypothetical protein